MLTPTFASSFAQTLSSYLENEYPRDKPGISVLVEDKDCVWFDKSFGLADVENQVLTNPRTNYRMASLTKQFTAMALALLQQENLLRFDQVLANFFPGWIGTGEQITLRHLLLHRSGLLDYEEQIAPDRSTQVQDEEVLEIAMTNQELYFPAGSAFRYSNTGYVLLGLVVEKVAGLPFSRFLIERLLQPLGIKNSLVYSPVAKIKHRAMGYAPSETKAFRFSDQSVCSATQADGCLYTSTQEYAVWHRALWQKSALLLAPLLTFENPIETGKEWFYDMGWFYAPRANGQPELYHTGNTCGFSHVTVSLPEAGLLVAAFSNRADNALLIPGLVDQIFKGLPYQLESSLIYHLPALTR